MRRLTDLAYWEENWWKRQRPRRLRLYRDFDFETVGLLRRVAGEGRARVLEVGGGGSRVLPYLRRKFGYVVFGSDFSLRGCLLLRANLALQGVEGGVVCEDFLLSSLLPETFDLVYSSGLIEHFDDTRAAVAAHLQLVKRGGRVVLIVPNLQGIQGRILKHLAPPLWDRHRALGPAELVDFLKALGLDQIQSGYLGSFFLYIGRDREWSVVKSWHGWLQLLAHGSLRLINGLISLLFVLSPWRPHSRLLSPGIFATGLKPAD